MNDRVRAIVEEARKLTPEERLELFDQLELEFAADEGDGTQTEVEAAWLEEVQRRIAKAEKGEITFVDAEDVLAQVRQLIR